jgi:hypothetical protein
LRPEKSLLTLENPVKASVLIDRSATPSYITLQAFSLYNPFYTLHHRKPGTPIAKQCIVTAKRGKYLANE